MNYLILLTCTLPNGSECESTYCISFYIDVHARMHKPTSTNTRMSIRTLMRLGTHDNDMGLEMSVNVEN